MKQLFYIHGANETALCFNYIKAALPEHEAIDIDYDCQAPIVPTIATILKKLPINQDIEFITHSYGGLIAVALGYYHKGVKKIVSLAAPFGGSEGANYLRFLFPAYGLFKNVATSNPLVQEISRRGATVPTLNIIATVGYNPFSAARNDGVITIETQRQLPGAKHVEVGYNHFELLLADPVVQMIKEFVWEK
jgi:pimeloyl-ACP methyl ester carboxylesterase